MKLFLNKTILTEWRQDFLGNWYRAIDHSLPKPPDSMDYKADIFVEVWNNPRSNGQFLSPWFKYQWMEDWFSKEFQKEETLELTKDRVDTFLLRLGQLTAFW
jgi:hypothetical protein